MEDEGAIIIYVWTHELLEVSRQCELGARVPVLCSGSR